MQTTLVCADFLYNYQFLSAFENPFNPRAIIYILQIKRICFMFFYNKPHPFNKPLDFRFIIHYLYTCF